MWPYTMSKYGSKEDLIEDVMIAEDLTEAERLAIVWNAMNYETKEKIKEISPNLYYCILSVKDEAHRRS